MGVVIYFANCANVKICHGSAPALASSGLPLFSVQWQPICAVTKCSCVVTKCSCVVTKCSCAVIKCSCVATKCSCAVIISVQL